MAADPRSTRWLLYTVYFIYFFCGLTQCFEGVFLPEFKQYFQLNYEQQMYTMFAKNIPFLLALVIGYFLARIGYKNCLTVAMALYAAGTLLLLPGLDAGHYAVVLLGFFFIGLGFNFQLVSGNPMLSALGPAGGSSSRLNLGNALGAVAQIIAPATLSFIIPAVAATVEAKLPYMKVLFAVLAAVLVVVSVVTAWMRNVDVGQAFQPETPDREPRSSVAIWANPRLLFGFATIFVILGSEAALFGFYRNFLEDPAIAGLTSRESQRLFTIYFALFAAGRLAASWIQKRMRPVVHLAICIAAAMFCVSAAILGRGAMAVVAVTVLGFFISIFFPTLYAIAIEGMGERTGQASGLLTMGFVGCALIPVFQGSLADSIGLQHSYIVAFCAYVLAALYAVGVYRNRRAPYR